MFHLHLGHGLVVRSIVSLLARNSRARLRRVSVEASSDVEVGGLDKVHSSHVMSACQGTLQEKQVLLAHTAHLTMGC
jgi:hypothetical protein